MAHDPKVYKAESRGNGDHAYFMRCCGERRTQRAHTISLMVARPQSVPMTADNPGGVTYLLGARTPEEIDALVQGRLAELPALHDAIDAGDAVLKKYQGGRK